jgi:hypothetical protein
MLKPQKSKNALLFAISDQLVRAGCLWLYLGPNESALYAHLVAKVRIIKAAVFLGIDLSWPTPTCLVFLEAFSQAEI